jgi:hypothetical protein
MDRQPVEPPNPAYAALYKAAVKILGHEESILAVLTESAIGVHELLSAISASYGIMAHDPSPKINNKSATKTRRL